MTNPNRDPAPPEPRFRLTPLTEAAWLARFDAPRDAAAWAAAVREADLPGVLDVVPAFENVAVFADPDRVEIGDELPARLAAIPVPPPDLRPPRRFRIRTLYDGEDLPEVARAAGLAVDEVVAIVSELELLVQAVGFLPGFLYVGDLPPPLAGIPRRSSPRHRVPPGSVALAGNRLGVYPVESPGGWNLLGRAPHRLADPGRDWFPVQPGDLVRFPSIDRDEYAALLGIDHPGPDPDPLRDAT